MTIMDLWRAAQTERQRAAALLAEGEDAAADAASRSAEMTNTAYRIALDAMLEDKLADQGGKGDAHGV